jgi:hypothetical protein
VLDGRVRSREGDDAERIQTVGLHPHCESFGAILDEPIVKFTLDGAMCILEEAKLLGEASLSV